MELATRFVSYGVERNSKSAYALIEMFGGSLKVVEGSRYATSDVFHYEVAVFGEKRQFENLHLLFDWLATVIDREIFGH